MDLKNVSDEELEQEIVRRRITKTHTVDFSVEEVKDVIKKSGVKQWQIAEYFGINEFSLSRKLRYGASEKFFNEIKLAIDFIKGE